MISRTYLGAIIEVLAAALALAFGWGRAALALDAPDFQPPRIEIVAPVPDSIVRESRPRIVLILRDEESGLDPAGFRLALDRADISRGIEAAAAADGTVTISHTPAASLAPGPHQVWFQAADMAGNPASVTWRFTVEETTPLVTDFRLSGRSATELSLLPLQRLTETLDLAAEFKLDAGLLGPLAIGAAVQVAGVTDYVGSGRPFNRFDLELGDYTIGVQGTHAGAMLGSVLVEFPARMLLPQMARDGVLLFWDGEAGSGGSSFTLAGFSGYSVTSYGFSITPIEYSGFVAQAGREDGSRLLAVVAETAVRADRARLFAAGGETPLGKGWRLFLEGAGSRAEDEPEADGGYALYAGLSGGTAASWLNLSLWKADADFDTPLLTPILAGGGGTRRITLDGYRVCGRFMAAFNAFKTWNNLDEAAPDAEDTESILVTLRFRPPGSLTYTANCQVVTERPSPGAAAGPGSAVTILSGAIDYLARPGGRETRSGLRYAASFTEGLEVPDTAAALTASRAYETGTLAAALEYATDYHPSDPETESLRLALTWQPRFSFGFLGLTPRLTGEIGASYEWREKLVSGAVTGPAKLNLRTKLELALTAADLLVFTGTYTWAVYDDYSLKIEYRRAF